MKALKGLAMLLLAATLTLGVSAQGTSAKKTTKTTTHTKANAKGKKTMAKSHSKATPKKAGTKKMGGSSK